MTTLLHEAQVCVIGAGVMGASAAFHLAERGTDVLILEQGLPGLEASGATAGTLALQNKKPAAIPLVLRALDLWARLSERLDADVEYEVRGGFRVAHTDEDVARLEDDVRTQRALGVATEVVYQPQLAAAAPYLSPAVQAGSYCAADGLANPFATVRAFLQAARRHGARLAAECRVRAIEARGDYDFRLDTDRGEIRCSTVVAAAGAWNLEVARMIGVTLPVHTELLQALITDFGPPLFSHVVMHVRGNLTLKQQRVTGKVLIGGAWPGDGRRETGQKRVRRESLVGNLKWAAETVPALERTRLLRGWVGYEGRSPDKLLLSGPMGPPGFYVIGCSGGGFTLSPIAGQIAAEYVVDGRPSIPCDAFNVQRFLGAPAGR